MMSPAAKSACLTVGLVSAWAPVAEAEIQTRVRVTETMPEDVSHSILMIAGTGSGSNDYLMLHNIGWSVGTPDFFLDRPMNEVTRFAVLGLTGVGSGFMHLVVSSPGLTYINGMAFEQAFPGVSEQALIDQLWTGGPGADAFFRGHAEMLLQGANGTANVHKFSTGSAFGLMSIEVTAVPTPGVLAVTPLALLAFRRRRR